MPEPTPLTFPRLLTTSDVASVLNCSVRTVQRLIEDGDLTPVQLGERAVRVAPAELKRFVANRTMTRRRRPRRRAA